MGAAVLAAAAAASRLAPRRRSGPRHGRQLVKVAATVQEDPAGKKIDNDAASEEYREMLRRGATDSTKSTAAKETDFFDFSDPEKQEDLKAFVTSISVALLFRFTIAEPRFIPSESMVPSFEVGDQLIVDKISKNWRDYQRRDVVVFDPPPLYWEVTQREPAGEALIKRIVAVEGDYIEMKEGGVLVVNGEEQNEKFTNEKAAYTFSRRQVPKGTVFALGDNRNKSLDGHVWGYLPVQNIIGRATFNWWPPWHVHGIAAAPP